MTKPIIYIDGEAGTTGLQILSRLKDRHDIRLLLLEDKRRDLEARRHALNHADLVILCLPDEEARLAIAMITNPKVRVIDASTAHRTHPDWVYGFGEYEHGHSEKIARASRVSNPGCYALTSVALLYPLIKAGLLPKNYPISLNAVSGYSGGGKKMITEYEKGEGYHLYGLSLEHKHLPEITKQAGLSHQPIFLPSVAPFIQGMAVELPISLWSLPKVKGNMPDLELFYQCYMDHYPDHGQVKIIDPSISKAIDRLKPQAMADQDNLEIHLFTSSDQERLMLIGLLDNLGKGASGQAVQSLNLMLNLA